MQTQPIVGVWQTAIKVDGLLQGFEGLYTFFADGNFLEINSIKETNSGIWQHNGDHYPVTSWPLPLDWMRSTPLYIATLGYSSRQGLRSRSSTCV